MPDIYVTVARHSPAAELLMELWVSHSWAPFSGFGEPCLARIVGVDRPTSETIKFILERIRS